MHPSGLIALFRKSGMLVLGGDEFSNLPRGWKARVAAVSTTQKEKVVCLWVQGCLEKQTLALQN